MRRVRGKPAIPAGGKPPSALTHLQRGFLGGSPWKGYAVHETCYSKGATEPGSRRLMPIATVKQLCTQRRRHQRQPGRAGCADRGFCVPAGWTDGSSFGVTTSPTVWNCWSGAASTGLAGRSDDGAFYLTQAMGGGKTHSLIAFGLLAADPGLRREVVPRISAGNDFGAAKVVIFNGHQNPETCFGATLPNSSARRRDGAVLAQWREDARRGRMGRGARRRARPHPAGRAAELPADGSGRAGRRDNARRPHHRCP